ncbi:hypothetical protein BDF19DRAFT_428361 [Syncephalis fuscata]|nr:hypothetical protein BDF19DRAFT_428361 [Syncephalis fuscata]
MWSHQIHADYYVFGVVKTSGGKSAISRYAQQLLVRYLVALNENPLRTKAITAGMLNGIQELVAQLATRKFAPAARSTATEANEARRPASSLPYDYQLGFLVSGPLTIIFMIFDSIVRYVIAQLLAANLVIGPILNTDYCWTYTPDQIRTAVRQGLPPMMRILSAQRYLPPPLWVPYFNLVGFVFGVYTNIIAKLRK